MITWITCFYKIYDIPRISEQEYINYFLMYALKGDPIILFLDPLYSDYISQLLLPNVNIILLEFDKLPIQFENVELPSTRNLEKDTQKYLMLINNKLEFIKLAYPNIKTEYVGWIDFGIAKITSNFEHCWEKVHHIHTNKVLIPGAWNKSSIKYDQVNWRFCGGLIISTLSGIETFRKQVAEQIEIMKQSNKISWEVNVWALAETDIVQWYKATHDDTMFFVPDNKIDYYKQCIAKQENVRENMYELSKCYYESNDLTEMEYWAMKAYEFDKKNIDSICLLVRAFRQKDMFYKAWHYLLLGKSIQESVVLDYEKTILNYYLNQDRKTSLHDFMQYYKHSNSSHYNLQFYVDPIPRLHEMPLPTLDLGDYTPSSTAMIRMNDEYILNIRYVNYRIQPDGSYFTMFQGNLTPTIAIHTRNVMLKTDLNFNPISFHEMNVQFPSVHDVNVKGLEDVRIYQDDGIKWIACSREYSHDALNRQVVGTYDIDTHEFKDGVSIIPPKATQCEKNWIPLGDNTFIYTWHPFQIIKVNENQPTTIYEQQTPRFFENMRGSTTLVEYENFYYCIVHCVQYTSPRKYYHSVIKLTKKFVITAWTYPFYFNDNSIEYCIGMDIIHGHMKAIVSQYDMNPVIITLDMNGLNFYDI